MWNFYFHTSIIFLIGVEGASKYYTGEIRPYEFGFKLEGNQHRHEMKDANGIIMGEFGFITADGVYHVTVYATDIDGNFKILSMKNIRLMKIIERIVTPSPMRLITSTPPPFIVKSTTPRITTTIKPNAFVTGCSGCKIPDLQNNNVNSNISTQPTTYFKDVNSNTSPSPPFKVMTTNNAILPQKLIERPTPILINQSITFSPLSKVNQSNNVKTPVKSPENIQSQKQSVDSNKLNNKDVQPIQPNMNMNQSNNKQKVSDLLDVRSDVKNENNDNKEIIRVKGNIGSFNKLKQEKPVTIGNYVSLNNEKTMKNVPTSLDSMKSFINGLLYRYNYDVGYHGHREEGDRLGNKEGEYYSVGRDGIKRVISYKANEFGYQPFSKSEKILNKDIPRLETEQDAGLKGYEFKWFYA